MGRQHRIRSAPVSGEKERAIERRITGIHSSRFSRYFSASGIGSTPVAAHRFNRSITLSSSPINSVTRSTTMRVNTVSPLIRNHRCRSANPSFIIWWVFGVRRGRRPLQQQSSIRLRGRIESIGAVRRLPGTWPLFVSDAFSNSLADRISYVMPACR